MALTHTDDDHMTGNFMKELKERAAKMQADGTSQIAAGKVSEQPLRHWKYDNMYVTKYPDDPQRILRVSVGGGIAEIDYCSFRGDRARCVNLLERALKALKHP